MTVTVHQDPEGACVVNIIIINTMYPNCSFHFHFQNFGPTDLQYEYTLLSNYLIPSKFHSLKTPLGPVLGQKDFVD